MVEQNNEYKGWKPNSKGALLHKHLRWKAMSQHQEVEQYLLACITSHTLIKAKKKKKKLVFQVVGYPKQSSHVKQVMNQF